MSKQVISQKAGIYNVCFFLCAVKVRGGEVNLVLICTSIEELNKQLNRLIPNSKIAYYSEHLIENKEANIVILANDIETHVPFKDFLFMLRTDDKRVILLLNNQKSSILGYALALGIYDITFDEINVNEIINMIHNPTKFSDVAPLFLGLASTVSFEDPEAESNMELEAKDDAPEGTEPEQYTEQLEKPKTKNSNITLLPNTKKEIKYKNIQNNYKIKAVAVLGTTKNAGSTAFTLALAKAMQKKGEKIRVVDAGGGTCNWLRNDELKCTKGINVVPGYITLFDMGNKIADGVIPLAQYVFIVTDNFDANPTLIMPYVNNNTYLVGNKGIDEDVVYALGDLKMVTPLFSLSETTEIIKAEQNGIAVIPRKWRKNIEKVVSIIKED